MPVPERATIAVDLDIKVHAHVALATFIPIPGVDMFDLAAVVAFLADMGTTDRRAVLQAAERVAQRVAGCEHCGAPADATGDSIPEHRSDCPTRDPRF